MNTKKLIKSLLILFVCMFAILSVYLVYIVNTYGNRWFASPYNTRVQNRRNTVTAGDILDRNGVVLAQTDTDDNRVYNSSNSIRMATAHIVGDSYGMTTGAESFFASYLLGFDQSAADMINDTIYGRKRRGSDIRLTIDSTICKEAYKELEGRNGAVVLMNYKTGEILASVSAPSFDPALMSEYINGDYELADGAMVNRVMSGQYTPGSVFKIVTTIAALRYIDNAEEITLNCTGELVFDNESGKYLGTSGEVDVASLTKTYSTVTDYQHTSHGSLTLKEAFSHSCNSYYGRLTMLLGAGNINKTAQSLGIGTELLFSDMMANSGKYTIPNRDIDIAWSGVGQFKDIMSPLNLCMITAAIANDGIMPEPRLLRMASAPNGNVTYTFTPKVYSNNALSQREASILKEYMLDAVANGTGSRASISGHEIGGKTGTAEVTVNGENLSHAWFTGFIDSPDHPLAICVIIEFGGSGGTQAAPLAKNIFKTALGLGY